MQVMPPTGKELNVGDITEIEPNVHAGVKYMRFMMDQYFKDEPMDDLNKGLMTFAAYNAGPGRLRQLRRETAQRGLDPNVWFGNVERVASERIGRETVTYVSNIYKYLHHLSAAHRSAGTTRRGEGSGRAKGGPVAMWKLSLDPTQKALITQLQASRETWHQTGTYNAEQYQEPPEVRRRDGASLRKALPHTTHAGWKPPKNRPNPVDIVVAGNAGRQQHLVPLRMARMSASPFAFLRGAAAVMAWDLSHTPVTGIQVVINGDAHINNFGLFGSLQREVIIDANDFDETTLGPWEWDLKRLVASVNVAGREKGMSRTERRIAVMQAVAGYRFNASRLATMGVLDVWSHFGYAERRPTTFKVPNKSWAVIQKVVAKAKATTNATLLAKVAQRRHDGGWRFVEDRPILTGIDAETRQKVVASLVEYAEHLPPSYRFMLNRYGVADVVHRVVGVGSVGTRAYLALLFGNGDTIRCSCRSRKPPRPRTGRTFPRRRSAAPTTAFASSARNASCSPSVIHCSATRPSTAGLFT